MPSLMRKKTSGGQGFPNRGFASAFRGDESGVGGGGGEMRKKYSYAGTTRTNAPMILKRRRAGRRGGEDGEGSLKGSRLS